MEFRQLLTPLRLFILFIWSDKDCSITRQIGVKATKPFTNHLYLCYQRQYKVFLLRKHTYNLLNSQKILQDSYFSILFKSHKNFSSSLTIYCSYLKSFPTIKDITLTRKLTKLTLVPVLIPYSYFKTRLCEKDRWKKVQKLSPFSFYLSH